MKKLITTLALGLAVLGLTAAPAQATNDRETVTMTWYLPAGVNPNTDPFTSWWPQTAAPVQDVWCQHDTYRYGTKKDRAIVDGLADDGLLTLVKGVPEDQAVYLSHTFTFCNPKPEPSPTPTPPYVLIEASFDLHDHESALTALEGAAAEIRAQIEEVRCWHSARRRTGR